MAFAMKNMILCVPVGENEFGKWYGFETLTLCYFDTSALLLELLTEEEKKWINDYHKTVYQKLAPFLNQEEVCWLAKKRKRYNLKRFFEHSGWYPSILLDTTGIFIKTKGGSVFRW